MFILRTTAYNRYWYFVEGVRGWTSVRSKATVFSLMENAVRWGNLCPPGEPVTIMKLRNG